MHQLDTIHVPDGAFRAYTARPDGVGPHPGVVVLQEIFGINAVVRGVCDALANEGYLAVAPDLFWRIEPNIDITDQTEAEWKRAMELFTAFDVDMGLRDIQAAIDWTRKQKDCTGRVATVGYCLGGLLAFLSAARTTADASVGYYAVGLENRLGEIANIKKPFLLHLAEADAFTPPAAQMKIKPALAANPHVTVFAYPGRDHAFARPGGAHYDKADAELANERTLEFLHKAQI
jgi:carboxymethylenebutenolidase